MKGFHIGTFGYVTESMVSSIVWPIFLFLILGNIEKLGGIISLGSLLSAGAVFFAGRLSDKGKRNTIFLGLVPAIVLYGLFVPSFRLCRLLLVPTWLDTFFRM